MKRTLSLILSLLMVLSLFTGLSVSAQSVGDDVVTRVSDLADTGSDAEIAQNGGNIIDTVKITGVKRPKPGQHPEYTAYVPEDAPYEVVHVEWHYDKLFSTDLLDETYTYRENKVYMVKVLLSPIGNYSFPSEGLSDVNATINNDDSGKSIVSWKGEKYFCVWKRMGCQYDLYLGSTLVTDANKNDILGDGGKAKYDPATHTLTLNDPVIPGVHEYIWDLDTLTNPTVVGTYKIFSERIPLTIKGSYHMTEAECQYGLYHMVDESNLLTLDGDFTFYGTSNALCNDGSDVFINSGNIKCYSNNGRAIDCDGGSFMIGKNVKNITAEGKTAFNVGNGLIINDSLGITEPVGAVIKKSDSSSNNFVYDADGETVATRVVIGNKEHLKYNLWLGGTQVTYKNRNDILGDGGKAKFDPESKTLTLNEPVISGVYERSGETNGEPWTNSYKIYSYGIPLAVKGSYHMNEAESDCAIYGDHSDLTLNGDFTVCGNAAGIYGNNSPITLYGTATANGGKYGIYGDHSDITINGGLTAFGEVSGIYGNYSPITLYGTATANGGNYGICGDHSDITINGDLTAFGEASGIDGYYADININGNVTSKGGTNGISGTGCDLNIDGGAVDTSGHNYGIILGGTLNISGNAWSVTADSYLFFAVRTTKGININNSGDQNVRVIEPDGGIIKKSDSSNYYYVYESDGTTIAKHALFSSHTPISSADCVVTEPVGGQQPDKTAVSGDSGKYNVSVVNWFKGTGDDAVLMTSRERFIAGETYSVRVRYTALDSYTFTGETNYTVNGKSTTYLGRNTYEATFTATVPPQPILAADCVVTEPIAGQTPNKTVVSGDSGKYSVEVINWYKGFGDSAELMPSRATFTAGETYSVRVRYTALDGYYLTTITEYTINGESPTYLGRGVYEATFTAINPAQPKSIAAISCTVTEPIAGQKPDYTAVPADITKYTATVSSWIKGTGRTARTMSADETFIAGETYQVQVKFMVMTGYTSTDDTVYTINGKTPTKITGREIYYSITFTNTPTAFLGDVDFDGNIEIRDATWIQRSVADIEIPFVIKKLSADVDGDGNITVMDATLIQYYLANMKNPYNIGKTVS